MNSRYLGILSILGPRQCKIFWIEFRCVREFLPKTKLGVIWTACERRFIDVLCTSRDIGLEYYFLHRYLNVIYISERVKVRLNLLPQEYWCGHILRSYYLNLICAKRELTYTYKIGLYFVWLISWECFVYVVRSK